jgi:hypothetical protein
MLGRGDDGAAESGLERRYEAVPVGEQLGHRAEVELVVEPGRRPGRFQQRVEDADHHPRCDDRQQRGHEAGPGFDARAPRGGGAGLLPWSRARNCTLHRPWSDAAGPACKGAAKSGLVHAPGRLRATHRQCASLAAISAVVLFLAMFLDWYGPGPARAIGGGINGAVVGWMLVGPLVLLIYEPVRGG